MRADGRAPDTLRPVSFLPGFAPAAAGSVLACFGRTRVICAVTVEEGVPRWMKEQGVTGGWITSEYAMLPYSTDRRKPRDSGRGKVDGRSVEIQRLIGRSLRAAVDLEALGPRTLWVDCDVLEADGGTRTAAITGSAVALGLACGKLLAEGNVAASPLRCLVAAVSAGVVGGESLLDLDYSEDKEAAVDFNVVMTDAGEFVELQGSGEEATFGADRLAAMLELARAGIARLVEAQRALLREAGVTPPGG